MAAYPYVAGSKGPPSLQKVPRDWGLTSPQNRTRKLQHTAPPSSASAASKERVGTFFRTDIGTRKERQKCFLASTNTWLRDAFYPLPMQIYAVL